MKGWRTVAFNLIMGAVMAWNILEPEKAIELDEQTVNTLLTTIWTVGNIVLRAITTTPIGTK